MNKLKSEKEYVSYKHLSIDEENSSVVYLGYTLYLTKTEYKIIEALMRNVNTPLSAEQISYLLSVDLSKENIAFHIFNINTKAKSISNRVLVKNTSKIGYFLNEEM